MRYYHFFSFLSILFHKNLQSDNDLEYHTSKETVKDVGIHLFP